MKQIHLYISGFVQGVGYRAFVKHTARKMGLTGWTRNLSDRRVEVVAQGDEEILKKLIEACKRGSLLSDVKNISVDWEEIGEVFNSFERLPTL
ncbi:MAG TPA: acylphosphatase [Patescibacteria group bacterium]|nr:acylphosphatase [Patescibacteria group bacterium]